MHYEDYEWNSRKLNNFIKFLLWRFLIYIHAAIINKTLFIHSRYSNSLLDTIDEVMNIYAKAFN